jgi:hypothetical protein
VSFKNALSLLIDVFPALAGCVIENEFEVLDMVIELMMIVARLSTADMPEQALFSNEISKTRISPVSLLATFGIW